MAKATKWVYFFGGDKTDGDGTMRELLGGKGAGLAEMTRIGLPVPAGFTITTEACDVYNKQGQTWPTGLDAQVKKMVTQLEQFTKKKFGSKKDPLLVSVRSGAARSMPGMMETILNLGLTDDSVVALEKASGNRRFALDAYRRLIMMYGATAMHIHRDLFDEAFDELKEKKTAVRLGKQPGQKTVDTEVDADELAELVETYKSIYLRQTGAHFPQDPIEQLRGAINAVFDSWMSDKAVTYRRVENISGLVGTAVNVCQMVFGNMGDDSGTGVCFTRDPSTGESVYYGDLLINAQGEDVVAGVRTPVKLEELQTLMPDCYDQLEAVRVMLECHYGDMQDLEFTFERGKLYMLQCRTGKRSPQAAFKIAVDQATKGLLTKAETDRLVKKKHLPKKYAAAATKPIITKEQAVQRILPADVERLFYPILDPEMPSSELDTRHLGDGIGAVPGAACGEIAFSAERAEERAGDGNAVLLVRKETSPEDVGGMHAASGILTATGGKTSHAAVVARGWGKCCIVGCDAMMIDYKTKTMTLGGKTLHEGNFLTLDGSTGAIYDGEIDLVPPEAPDEYNTLMNWCDELRTMKVRANADTPSDALKAVELGAEGIGLCRTEHMFFDPSQPQRLSSMRQMILADNEEDRRRALDKLLPYQREDFEGIFAAMHGLPVTVRLLDPPLHEFLPQADNLSGLAATAAEVNRAVDDEIARLSLWDEDQRKRIEAKRVTAEQIARRVEQLHESNPMLGHRGCRLSLSYPEILEMQVKAIIEAAIDCAERGTEVIPEIMIPLSIDAKELAILTERTRAVADEIIERRGATLHYLVGTMIETPRAALTAADMAEVAEFFSFGTNDLTQTTMALSRDDAGRFLPDYVDEDRAGIFPHDPFQTIDEDGVGLLIEYAVETGRISRPDLKLGVCGEHGGDPQSIEFCARAGLDYVSCSPFRVPIARLACAKAALAARAATPADSRKASAPAAKAKPATRTKASKKKAASATKTAKAKRPAAKKASAKKKTAAAKRPAAKTKAKKKSAAPKASARKASPTTSKKKAAKKSAKKTAKKASKKSAKTAKRTKAKKSAAKKSGKKKSKKGGSGSGGKVIKSAERAARDVAAKARSPRKKTAAPR